jgi:hypothetical protein
MVGGFGMTWRRIGLWGGDIGPKNEFEESSGQSGKNDCANQTRLNG